jgi:hypothetical protein
MRKVLTPVAAIIFSLVVCGLACADGGVEKSVTGNLRDGYCNTTMGANGPSHKKCAISCAKAGIPVVMVEKGTNQNYILIPAKDDQPLPKDVIDHMEDEVTVSGKVYAKDGINYLQVESVK